MKIETGPWDLMKDDARAVRYQVFVIEQGVPVELEWDDMDAVCLHALARDNQGHAVATGRLLPDGHIGRMAVRKDARGTGIGSAVLEALIATARARGDVSVMLNAQTRAAPFYERFGFTPYGEEFVEAGIPHIAMRRSLG